jgi:hypothetical protein
MDEDHLVDKPKPKLTVGPMFRKTQHDSKFITKILQALFSSEQLETLETPQQQFCAISQKSVVVVLHNDTLENLAIGSADQSFKDQHNRYYILVLPPTKS